jgi:hypothetical protein
MTTLVAIAHALAGAAWFGAMFYSLTVMQPRAVHFFSTPAQFEEFIAFVSHGARWKVLGAFAFVAATGIALFLLCLPAPPVWLGLIAAKVALFFVALAVFVYTSWWLWPARVFVTPEEIPSIQRRFRIIGWTMIALVGLNLALGVAAHRLKCTAQVPPSHSPAATALPRMR